MANTNYAVDDEFGNLISAGLESYDAALQCSRRYLSAHDDAPSVTVYEDTADGESWELSRDDVLT